MLMRKNNHKSILVDQSGSLLVPLIVSASLCFLALVFGIWAFASRQSYKNDSDSRVSAAVKEAEKEVSITKDSEYAEAAKEPLQSYVGNAALGTVTIKYPKTWNMYVQESVQGSSLTELLFHPGYIPASGKLYATHLQVVTTSYEDSVSAYQKAVGSGEVTIAAYALPSVPDRVGTMVTGQISKDYTGVLVLIPIRDKTLAVWTEGQEYRSDFESIILKNLTFIP
jgi:hypothetical protein